jgi:CubicO group peptidase (beta-lactamase class C family)
VARRARPLFAALLALSCRDAATPAADAAAPVDPCVVRAGELPERHQSIALSLCREVAAHGVGGAVAIAQDGAIALTFAAGRRCAGKVGDIGNDTAFRIGSITKVLVAATAVALAHDGAIDLDAPLPAAVAAELPALPATTTLRALLDHTAGLADALPDAAMRERPANEVLTALVRASGDPPGTWRYANPGYAIAGVALERAMGRAWTELVRAEIVEPLALAHTLPATPRSVPDDVACGHLRDGEAWRAYDVVQDWHELAFDVDVVAPSGAAIASASDLVRFALALTDRPPAGTPPALPAMLRELRARAVPTGAGDRYALGLHVHALPDGATLLRHAGNTGDFAADLVWVPERGLAVAVLGNSGAHLRGTLAVALARAGIDPRVLATGRE